MKKFEYYTINLRAEEDVVQVLDRYGENGWEAVQMLVSNDETVVLLKRENRNEQRRSRKSPANAEP